ncbi:TRAP transporter large permease [Marinobacterium aestuariivivens]|uniref:TRAP transporter large permease protein n=1 Tax=Marinobacterium aestuariivivens TaxID=1698799 RepID=A0ABW2A5D7_9GAMM
MDDSYIVLTLFGSLTIALALGIPVGIALGIATALGLTLTSIPLVYITQTLYTGVGMFPLIAIPGFVLAGLLMERSGLTHRIVKIVTLAVGNVPGGLAVVTIISCMFFASLTGSGPATTAAIGGIMIPAMMRAGYSVSFAAAVAATGGALGILIPPSNPMIIYGVMANVSVGGLFMAGVLPGVLLATGLAGYCVFVGRRRGLMSSSERFSLAPFIKACWDGKAALFMPVVVLGSIYGGFATPTEASMLAVVYAAAYGLLTRQCSFKNLAESMIKAGSLTGAILIIMGPAMAFGKLITLYNIPSQISDVITSLTSSPLLILIIIAMLLVFIGTFMETLSTIVLLVPVFLPALLALGVDPVHFGILFVVLSEVGFLTPPLGVNLYVASAISGQSIESVSKAVLPFLMILLLFCALLIIVPDIATIGYGLSSR